MSERRFLTELQVTIPHGDDDLHVLLAPLIYRSDVLGTIIAVPKGFPTDLASVPRFPLAYMLTGGKAKYASVVHDYLLVQGFLRAKAALVFVEAMQDTDVAPWRQRVMYRGVRMLDAVTPDPEHAE